MELLRYALARLRHDLRRALATGVAVLIAVTSFVTLTGSAETQRLDVTQTLNANFRGAYDILVRPKGSTTPREREQGLVRGSFLSGMYGGITLDQVAAIKKLAGVEVAAPIAMVGVTFVPLTIPVDVTTLIPPGQKRTLIRYTIRMTSRNGAITAPALRGIVYVTREKFQRGDVSFKTEDGGTYNATDAAYEVINGKRHFPCLGGLDVPARPGELYWHSTCVSLAGGNDSASIAAPGKAAAPLQVSYPLLIAGVDPGEEARLVGLDRATVAGRPLTDSDAWTAAQVPSGSEQPQFDQAPALLSTAQDADYATVATFETLPATAAEEFIRAPFATNMLSLISTARAGEPSTTSTTANQVYADYLKSNPPVNPGASADGSSVGVLEILRTGEVQFQPGEPLRALPVEPSDNPLKRTEIDNQYLPGTVWDTGFRKLANTTVNGSVLSANGQRIELNSITLKVVGHYDPSKLDQGGALGRVPLETYAAPVVTAADPATKTALGGDVLKSNLSPADYVQLPPSVLIPIKSLDIFNIRGSQGVAKDPVSAVRVRVAGVTGFDEASRERIRLTAQLIAETTGLDVDVTAGSSQTPQRVDLPKTELGVPALQLNELWSAKGVAVTIGRALDAKSVLLFVLILVSSALTVAASANAAVQARRKELGILGCLGWTPGRIRSEVLLELALIGGAAGLLGAALSWPLAAGLGINFDPVRAWWTIPIALVLTVGAGLMSTRAAGRASPIDAIRPAVSTARRPGRPVRSPIALGVRQIIRRPARLALGAAAVALATASVGLLVSIVAAFQGAVVGTFLGDAVALQVRGPDVLAAAFLGLLGAVAVAVVLLLGLSEDVRSFAALQAVGWRDGQLVTIVAAQAGTIGLVGGVVGALAGLGLIAGIIGTVNPTTVLVLLAVAVAALMLSLVVSLIPAAALRRLPTARLLAEE